MVPNYIHYHTICPREVQRQRKITCPIVPVEPENRCDTAISLFSRHVRSYLSQFSNSESCVFYNNENKPKQQTNCFTNWKLHRCTIQQRDYFWENLKTCYLLSKLYASKMLISSNFSSFAFLENRPILRTELTDIEKIEGKGRMKVT